MGKAGKWIKSFLVGGKKDKDKEKEKQLINHHSVGVTENPVTPMAVPPATPKEKRRWSFRRSSATAPGPKECSSNESTPTKAAPRATSESPDIDKKPEELPEAEAEAIVVDDTITESEAAAAESEMIRLLQEAAATKIQSVFRSYLARKALRALRGLVKIQALVRGHLVRKQATATLRCMQALVTAQARARALRIRSAEEEMYANQRHSAHRMNNQDYNFRNSYHEMENGMMDENIKIVEMDLGESNSKTRNGYSNYHNNDRMDHRFSPHYAPQFDYVKQDYQKVSPAPSAITDMSPRTCSGHFEDYSFATAQSSPQCYYSAVSRPDPSKTPFAFPHQEYTEPMSYDHPLYPNYMANTQSSRAKARSQSAPKQRPDAFERQPSRRRPSVEGRNIPRAVRMQRSTSHVGATAHNYQYPWSIKLDKSTLSLQESECGSTYSVLTNANYCKSVISYDPQGNRY